jgi:hypothetical protein
MQRGETEPDGPFGEFCMALKRADAEAEIAWAMVQSMCCAVAPNRPTQSLFRSGLGFYHRVKVRDDRLKHAFAHGRLGPS